MSTGTLERPVHRHEAPPPGSTFTGTFGLLRLYLRRDRAVLPLWVLLMSAPLAPVYMASIEKVYPTEADRTLAAATIMANASMRALYGNIYNDSLGAVGIWKTGLFHTLIAVAVDSHRHPPHPRRGGNGSRRADRLHGRRPVRQPHRGVDSRVRRVDRHRCIGAASLSTAPVPRSGSWRSVSRWPAPASSSPPSRRSRHNRAQARARPAALRSPYWDSRSPCVLSGTPAPGRCPGCRPWAGRYRSAPTPATAGGCCCFT